jgi:hypothetical protein
MAIDPAVPGLEVTVEVDNVALPEYQCDYEDDTSAGDEAFENSVTKYLEVPSGTEFSVRWLLKEPFDATLPTHADVMLDGFYVQSPLRETGDRDDAQGYKYTKAMSKEGGQAFTQTFRFSELEIGQSPEPCTRQACSLTLTQTINHIPLMA